MFFLEEWIQHYKLLGINQIVFINNGIRPTHKNIIQDGEQWYWGKKPYLDYNWEYSDQEIEKLYLDIVEKYGVISIDQLNAYSNSNYLGEVISELNLDNDYWLFIDPDEYLLPRKHNNLVEFLADTRFSGYDAFVFNQRVFDIRDKKKKVADIKNYSRELSDYKKGMVKTLVKNDRIEYDIHESKPSSGKIIQVPNEWMIYHHYRGPFSKGDTEEFQKRRSRFNKQDDSMLKFYERNVGLRK